VCRTTGQRQRRRHRHGPSAGRHRRHDPGHGCSTSWSAATWPPASPRCASAPAWAPPPSSSASERGGIPMTNDRLHDRRRRHRHPHLEHGRPPMNVLNDASIAAFGAAVRKAVADPQVKGVIVTSAAARVHRRRRPEPDPPTSKTGAEHDAAGVQPFSCSAARHRDRRQALCRRHQRHGAGRRLRDLRWPATAASPPTTRRRCSSACPKSARPAARRRRHAAPAAPDRHQGRPAAPARRARRPRPPRRWRPASSTRWCPPRELLARARAWLLKDGAAKATQPWDSKGFKLPGGAGAKPGRLRDLHRRQRDAAREDLRQLPGAGGHHELRVRRLPGRHRHRPARSRCASS
jgi:hypothetical protein